MPLTICTWNINSVRLREPAVLRSCARRRIGHVAEDA